MANGIFNTDTGKPITVRAGKATVKCDGKTLIALDVTVTYQRAVEIVPTLGSKRVLSIGEGQGEFTANTVLAKGNDVLSAMHLNDDGCKPFNMTISFEDSACDANGITVTAHNCVASAVSITAQGGRGYIAQGVRVTFTALSET